MSDSEDQATRLAETVAEAEAELLHKEAELRRLQEETVSLRVELENARLRAELDALRAVDQLRGEHEAALCREREIADADRKRMEDWFVEKKLLEEAGDASTRAGAPTGEDGGGYTSAGGSSSSTRSGDTPSGDEVAFTRE